MPIPFFRYVLHGTNRLPLKWCWIRNSTWMVLTKDMKLAFVCRHMMEYVNQTHCRIKAYISTQPITDVTSDDIICNGGINPYQQPVSTVVIPVPAGSPVTAEFHHTLAGADPSDPADPIDPSHKGTQTPMIVLLNTHHNCAQSRTSISLPVCPESHYVTVNKL